MDHYVRYHMQAGPSRYPVKGLATTVTQMYIYIQGDRHNKAGFTPEQQATGDRQQATYNNIARSSNCQRTFSGAETVRWYCACCQIVTGVSGPADINAMANVLAAQCNFQLGFFFFVNFIFKKMCSAILRSTVSKSARPYSNVREQYPGRLSYKRFRTARK